MKLRIHNDSIRLRLTVSEVKRIGAGRSVLASTRFPGGRAFTYALVTTRERSVSASLDGHILTVRLPADEASAWAADPDCITLRGEPDERCGMPALLVEKDFECLAPRAGDDATDLFVNPRETYREAAIPTPT